MRARRGALGRLLSRPLSGALAVALLLPGCATSSPESELVDAFNALVAEANERDATGVQSAVSAFTSLVNAQRQDGELGAQEAQALINQANKIAKLAGALEQPTTAPTTLPPTTQAPAPVVTEDDDEDEKKREEEARKREEEARKRAEEERKREEERRRREAEQSPSPEPVQVTVEPQPSESPPAEETPPPAAAATPQESAPAALEPPA